jgi:hypothetical protein
MIKIVKGKYTQNINKYQVVIFIHHHPYLPGHVCPPCISPLVGEVGVGALALNAEMVVFVGTPTLEQKSIAGPTSAPIEAIAVAKAEDLV